MPVTTETDKTEKRFKDRLAVLATVGVVAWTAAVLTYMFWFRDQSISNSAEQWGQFGDYLGGVVNPLIGLATVVLLALSISTQREELQETKKELKATGEATAKMALEQSLFSWLQSYSRLLESIVGRGGNTGRRVLQDWHDERFSDYAVGRFVYASHLNIPETRSAIADSLATYQENPIEARNLESLLNRAIVSYSALYSEHRSDLDALFRTLFRLLAWIDESDLSPREKWHYVALVRAQVSWIELVFLTFNCLTDRGAPFAELANKYSFFDNLDVQADAILEVLAGPFTAGDLDASSVPRWPLKPSAFDSKLGRLAMGVTRNNVATQIPQAKSPEA